MFVQTPETFRAACIVLKEYVRDTLKSKAVHWVYLDAHSSHLCFEALEMLSVHGFRINFLPAHTSHRLQPADKGLNACVKACISRVFYEQIMRRSEFAITIPFINMVRTCECGTPRLRPTSSCDT